jgi:hypothetical protein
MTFDTGQYPPPRKVAPQWVARRDGYVAGMSPGCARWLGAQAMTNDLQSRVGATPSAFIRIPMPDSTALVWPIQPEAFDR